MNELPLPPCRSLCGGESPMGVFPSDLRRGNAGYGLLALG